MSGYKTHRIKRLWQSLRFMSMHRNKRKRYSETHRIFGSYGDNITFQPKSIPLYPQLIKLHDNVVVGRNVEFVTHDLVNIAINHCPGSDGGFKEMCGCIEVMDNVFIGNGAIIMYGVRIAENNIIAAGSVVTKSTEPNSVYAGVPARRIGSIFDVIDKRAAANNRTPLTPVQRNLHITNEEIDSAWHRFYSYNDR